MKYSRDYVNDVLSSLDMESIDALAKAVNEFEGGMVLVSHDMRLISQVAKEIWICDNKTITKYRGDIQNFKMDMRAQMHLEEGGDSGKSDAGKGKLKGDASVMKKTEADLEKERKKKEKSKSLSSSISNGYKKSGSGSLLDSILSPKPRELSENGDVWDVKETLESLPRTEPAPEPVSERKKYVPPHLRNKK